MVGFCATLLATEAFASSPAGEEIGTPSNGAGYEPYLIIPRFCLL
jgi:hypothetical protein